MTKVQTPENPFGIVLVDENDVPDAPRKVERNDAIYQAAKVILEQSPGKWAAVKVFNTVGGAGVATSQINGGKNKTFPASDGWEARYNKNVTNKDKNEGTSTLFLRYVPAANSEATAEAAAE